MRKFRVDLNPNTTSMKPLLLTPRLLLSCLALASGLCSAQEPTPPREVLFQGQGASREQVKTVDSIDFSGYRWTVKNAARRGPGPNQFEASRRTVFVSRDGQLHLKIERTGQGWACSEVILDHSLGQGRYSFDVSLPHGELAANVVLGLFTYSEMDPPPYKEIDVEISRWGDTTDKTNAQFVVQPYTEKNHRMRFTVPTGAGASTRVSFDWTPSEILFNAQTPPAPAVRGMLWSFHERDIPTPGREQLHLNLWLYKGEAPLDGKPQEVVLSNFTFIPYSAP